MADAECGATPFLDRRVPLPAPLTFRSAIPSTISFVIVSAAISGVAAAAWRIDDFDDWLMRPHVGYRLAAVLFWIIGSYVAAVGIHELGHVLGGISVGFRFQHLRISVVMIDRSGRLSFHPERNVMTGEAKLAPPPAESSRFSYAIMVAA